MNYNEKVEYLIKTEKLQSNDPEIQRRVHDIKQDVLSFEYNVFYTFVNSIKNLINQIHFLKQQKEKDSDELFISLCDAEINKYQESINQYQIQINDMYSKDTIKQVYEKRKESCVARINYAKKAIEVNKENKVLIISLNDSLNEMKEIDFYLDILNNNLNLNDDLKKQI